MQPAVKSYSIRKNLFACAAAMSGILAIEARAAWVKRSSSYLISLVTGALASVSSAYMTAKSYTMNSSAPIFLLAGLFDLHLMNCFLNKPLYRDSYKRTVSACALSMISIGLCSFIDGPVYSVKQIACVSARLPAAAAVLMMLSGVTLCVSTALLCPEGSAYRLASTR